MLTNGEIREDAGAGADGPILCPGCLASQPRIAAPCEACGAPRRLRDRYWIEAVLGARGSSRTLRASERLADGERPVVIKELVLAGTREWKEVELFERGIKVLRGLGEVTRGIPRYLDHFEESRGGALRLYLVQEWIPGRSLAEALAAGARFDEGRARVIADELLATLGAIHRLSPPVVHRDVKPGNIVERAAGEGEGEGEGEEAGAGRPRHILVDFDMVQDTLRPDGGSTMALGTAGYAPIEQLMGHALPASDLYALGATLIALLSRKDPSSLYDPGAQRLDFRGHIQVSPGFADVLGRLVAPSTDARFASAAAVEAALAGREELVRAGPPGAVTGAPAPARVAAAPLMILGLSALVIMALGAGVVLDAPPLVLGLIVAVGLLAARIVWSAARPAGAVAIAPDNLPQETSLYGHVKSGAIEGGRRARGPASAPGVVAVGRGYGGIEIGASTVADVLATFGDDCVCYSYDRGQIPGPEHGSLAGAAQIWLISYDYDASGEYEPSRRANRRRPASVDIDSKRGTVKLLTFGVYQSEIRTAEGLTQASTLDQVIALYGDGYTLERGDPLDTYWYPSGVEIWVNPATGIVNSLRIFAPETP